MYHMSVFPRLPYLDILRDVKYADISLARRVVPGTITVQPRACMQGHGLMRGAEHVKALRSDCTVCSTDKSSRVHRQ